MSANKAPAFWALPAASRSGKSPWPHDYLAHAGRRASWTPTRFPMRSPRRAARPLCRHIARRLWRRRGFPAGRGAGPPGAWERSCSPDEAARRALVEAIVHPRVQRRALSVSGRPPRTGAEVVLLEVPLLFETGMDALCGEAWRGDRRSARRSIAAPDGPRRPDPR